ncbi:MAG TPA: hypothetical protein VFP80_13930 [Thermoanaerobaculia bacterium]|nr:hypothetical protein [Thermoanaerobaculia bacterium]
MIVAAVIALLVLPLVVLRGRTLLRYFGVDAATWLFAWIVWRRLPGFDPDLALGTLAVLKLATFSLFLAAGEQVRWSANRAALLAAIVYAIAIPAMLAKPIDGDEPFYLLVTDSVTRDFDLDLANQYRARIAGQWERGDVVPQLGDPVGRKGEQYSRHEPFLALLMIPGYLLAGLYGAIATIALFGVLLARSTVRWMEDEGIAETSIRGVFPFFAFAPPVLFYATRIWPEVPAAFFFVEALRGVRSQRAKRWMPAVLGLVLLKLRFVLVAVGIVARDRWPVARAFWSRRNSPGHWQRATGNALLVLLILAVPLVVVWFITGDPMNVHTWRELVPMNPMSYVIGLCGLLVDGMSGLLFQAPFYLFAIVALTSWKTTPPGFRTGLLASLLYVFYLIPRGEWFGGWAPPLRYLVFLMPVLALGIASVWEKLPRETIALVSAWTIGLVIHGVAYPWRLFHEFTGENAVGEWLSSVYHTDFSRLFPSFVRLNAAAWLGLLIVLLFGVRRQHLRFLNAGLLLATLALALALAFRVAQQPGRTVHFEDAHVTHQGGKLYPDQHTVMRTAFAGGWVLEANQSATFLAREGTHTLHFITGLGATFELAGNAYSVPADERYQTITVKIPKAGPATLKVLSGAINVDRMDAR